VQLFRWNFCGVDHVVRMCVPSLCGGADVVLLRWKYYDDAVFVCVSLF